MPRFQFKKPRGMLAPLYEEARLPADVRKSLNAMMGANFCGTLHGILCGGGTTAMVGLAAALGAGDMEFGLLIAIPQIAALLQLPFSMLVNKTRKRKIYLLTIGLFSRALWLFFGFLPMLGNIPESRLPLYALITMLGLSSACGAAINVCWFPWFSDLAPIRIRGRWLSVRDVVTSIGSLVFGLFSAYLLDVLPFDSKYVIIFLIGGMLGMMDMLCFAFAKEQWKSAPQQMNMRKNLVGIVKNKPFMRFVLMWTAWCFTANLSGAYLTPYSMNVMNLTFMQITVFGTVAASLATVLLVPRWGQALDRFGSRNVMLVSCIGASLTPIFYLLATPGNVLPTLLHNLFGAMFWCGSNLAANSMQLSSSPDDTRPTYIAVFSCITAMAGVAFGTMVGGWFLEYAQANSLFTGWMDRYKVLALVSVVLRFGLVLLVVPTLHNDSEGTPGDIIRFLLPKKPKGRLRNPFAKRF